MISTAISLGIIITKMYALVLALKKKAIYIILELCSTQQEIKIEISQIPLDPKNLIISHNIKILSMIHISNLVLFRSRIG